MIVERCDFDPARDITPVDQVGYIDLKSALANSCVPSQLPGSDVDYNGIDDPNSILGTPSDIFEAMDMQAAAEAAASDASFSDEQDG